MVICCSDTFFSECSRMGEERREDGAGEEKETDQYWLQLETPIERK